MIVTLLKCLAVGLLLVAGIQAEPGDRIPNHPNCPNLPSDLPPHYLPHPTNCSRFYECRQKDAWEFECPAGLHFNTWLNLQLIEPRIMSGWSILALLALVTLTVASDLRESCNRCGYRTGNQIQSHAHCSTSDSNSRGPRYFRDRLDCGKFYECNRGTAYEFLCSEGLAFNEEAKICEPASRVRCPPEDAKEKERSVTHELVSERSDDGHQRPRDSIAGQNRTCNICKKAKQAIARHANCPTSNGYYPVMFRNAKDCSQFYQCDHGTAYLIQCPAGLHFNTRINVCDYPRNVDCSGPVLNPAASTSAPSSSRGPGTNIAATAPSCSICQTAKHVVHNHPSCPTKNGYYPAMFRHRSECSKFYQCNNGDAYEIECPAGLHFNTATSVCDYPRNVDCSNQGAPTEHPHVDSETSRPSVDEPQEQGIHPNCPVITGRQGANYWAHPRDCGKYFGCQWGCVELLSCPDGHRWDEKQKACAAEHLVKCKNDGY
uniref:Chitin-binding type-2 domain-containing protein n=1 Tax=Anopheles dirus TaxID=7168 RepID=A0A182NJ62_9DIPT